MSFTCIVNLSVGFVLLWHAWMVFADTKTGDDVVDWVRKKGQAVFGEDWHIHEYIVGGLILVLGIFFCVMGFSIFASKHDWWVLRWL